MKNVISMKEYIHNRDHAGMGCGPMHSCAVCAQNMGDTIQNEPLITSRELLKYLLLATASTLFIELVVRKKLLGK